MITTLSSLRSILVEYRDLGLAATALLLKGDTDTADLVLNQRAEVFAQFQCADEDMVSTEWHKTSEFMLLGSEIQAVDQKLESVLRQAIDDLSKDVGRLGEARRTLKGYRSGETGDTFFTRMA